MPITFKCPACEKPVRAPDNLEGRKVKCPQCGQVVTVPAAKTEGKPEATSGAGPRRPERSEPPGDVEDRPRPKRRDDESEGMSASKREGRPGDKFSSSGRGRPKRDDDDEGDRGQSFEPALGDFGLVRSVSGVPTGIFENVPLDDRRRDAMAGGDFARLLTEALLGVHLGILDHATASTAHALAVGATLVQERKQEKESGNEPCGWIGVAVSPMTPAFADAIGMAEPYGAIFNQPEADSPAANAGI